MLGHGYIPTVKISVTITGATHPVDGAYLSSGFVCYKGMIVVELADLDVKGTEVENVLAAGIRERLPELPKEC